MMKRGDKAVVKAGDHLGERVEVVTLPIGNRSDVVVVKRLADGWGFTCRARELEFEGREAKGVSHAS